MRRRVALGTDFSDHAQKMQKFAVTERKARLNIIKQRPICVFQRTTRNR